MFIHWINEWGQSFVGYACYSLINVNIPVWNSRNKLNLAHKFEIHIIDTLHFVFHISMGSYIKNPSELFSNCSIINYLKFQTTFLYYYTISNDTGVWAWLNWVLCSRFYKVTSAKEGFQFLWLLTSGNSSILGVAHMWFQATRAHQHGC